MSSTELRLDKNNRMREAGVSYLAPYFDGKVFEKHYGNIVRGIESMFTGSSPDILGMMSGRKVQPMNLPLFIVFGNFNLANSFQLRQLEDWTIAYMISEFNSHVTVIDPLDWVWQDSDIRSHLSLDHAKSNGTVYFFRRALHDEYQAKRDETALWAFREVMSLGIPCVFTGTEITSVLIDHQNGVVVNV